MTKSALLFILAGLCEIGGGYFIWIGNKLFEGSVGT